MVEKSATIDKPSVIQEAEPDIQKALRSDISYLDKMRRDPKLPDNVKKSLYWYGALPSMVPTKYKGMTTLELWNRADGMPIWVGKCQSFQNIAIRGVTFSAFTGSSQRSPHQDPSQPISYGLVRAGFVEEFTDEQVKQILFEADHHMVRQPSDGKPPSIYRMIEVPQGSGTWMHESQDPTFNTYLRSNYISATDTPVSDYVYFVKIKDTFQQHDLISLMKNPPASLSGR